MKKRISLKSEVKEITSKKHRKNIYLALIILIVGVLVYAIYFNYYITKSCGDIECYEAALLSCERILVVNEDENYVWRYEVLNEKEAGFAGGKLSVLCLASLKRDDTNKKKRKDDSLHIFLYC